MIGFTLFVKFILGISATAFFIYAISTVQGNGKITNQQWANIFAPLLGVLLIHLGIWWMLPEVWWLWASQNGFVLSHMIVIFGLYLYSLADGGKTSRILGRALVVLGVVIMATNIYHISMVTMGKPAPKLSDLWMEAKASEKTKDCQLNKNSPSTGICGETLTTTPATGWSRPISTPQRFWFNPEGPGKIRVNGDDTRVHSIDKDLGAQIGSGIRTIEFQSGIGKPMQVALVIR